MSLALLSLLILSPVFAQSDLLQPCSTQMPTVAFEGGYSGDPADLRAGYFVRDLAGCWWTPRLLTYGFWDATPLVFSTRAIWQADGVIEATAAMKGIDLSDVAGGIAINSCAHDGETAWLTFPDAHSIETRIVDCAYREHVYYRTRSLHSALEVSYDIAEQNGILTHVPEGGGVGMFGVVVCIRDTLAECIDAPVDYN